MKKIVSLIFFVLVLPVVTFAGDFEIKFGLVKKDNQGQYYVYKETTDISLIYKENDPEYRFGYTVKNPSGKQIVNYSILHLPSKPQQYSGDLKGSGKKDEGNSVQMPAQTGTTNYTAFFRFDKGDPPGSYKLDIFVNQKLERTIEFTVVRSKTS